MKTFLRALTAIAVFLLTISMASAQTTVNELVRNSGNPIQGGTVQYLLEFANPVSGVSASNFTLSTTGAVSGASIGTISGSGSAWTIDVNTGSGEGTVTLNLNNTTGISPAVTNVPYTGQTFTIDLTPPSVTDMEVPADGTYGVGGTLTLVIGFNEPVIVNTSGGTPYIGITLNSGAVHAAYMSGSLGQDLIFTYTVAPGDSDPDGIVLDNAITLNGGTIRDFPGNFASSLPLAGVPSTSNVFVDATSPAVNSIVPADANPTTATSVNYTVTFSKDVIGVTAGAFSVQLNGAVTGTVNSVTPVSASVYTVNVNGVSGAGTIRLDLTNTSGIFDTDSNALSGTYTSGQVYTINNGVSGNATLSTIKLTPFAILTKTTGIGDNNFVATEPYYVTSVTLTAVGNDPNQTIFVNGNVVASGVASAAIPLNIGQNTITTLIRAQDGSVRHVYITVTRSASNNANLQFMRVSGSGMLTPAFAAGTTSYRDTVPTYQTTATVTPKVSNPGAMVTVNGLTVVSGSASSPINLNVGDNNVSVVVTAEDRISTKTYNLVITRTGSHNSALSFLKVTDASTNNVIPLSPAFQYTNTSYSTNLPGIHTSGMVYVTATVADPTATLNIGLSSATSKVPFGPIRVNAGLHLIPITVTAADGSSTGYNVSVFVNDGGITIPDESVAIAKTTGINATTDGIVVHQGVSPNGDGVNDYLHIEGINSYPDNKLVIMNRNGSLVYEARGYDNASRIFDGRSSKTRQLQLPGTYFYSLEYTSKGVIRHVTGYIILKY